MRAPGLPPLADQLLRLGSSAAGLASEDAARRLANVRPAAHRRLRARIGGVVRVVLNPLIAILLVACVASALLGEVADAAIIGAIVGLSGAVNFWQTFRSERAVQRLQASVAPTASVLRDGRWRELPRSEVVPGDVVRLSAGDLIPADVRLIEGVDLHVQQAALTGESLPAEKAPVAGPLATGGPDCPALAFLGTSVVSGSATALVLATGSATEFGDIVATLAARPPETEFERGMRRFGMLILQTVIVLVFSILVINVALGRDALSSILFSVALAVGLTPEFLPMITTVTLAQGAVRMARDKVIVKHLSAIQNLGSIDILCSDKTGTLTSGTMTLAAALDPAGGESTRALELARINSTFESGIASPLDAAILAGANTAVPGAGYRKRDEIPFDFERRRLSVVVERDGALLLVTKGAPESVLAACTHYESAGGVKVLDDATRARCLALLAELGGRGFRVLAVASCEVAARAGGFSRTDEHDLVLAGFVTFADQVLPGVRESIAGLARDEVDVKILTGDSELVTAFVCAQCGIDAGQIVLGSELDALDETALAHLAAKTRVFARVSPGQKHRIIRALQTSGHVVGFLGDGINDAPSLHAADVGISVAGAVDVAREASDIILLERRLDVLHAGIRAGRRSFGNVLKYLLMGTSSNFGNMFSMVGAALFLPFLPMLPTQILLTNFLYDFAQLAIPTDRVDPLHLKKPQRWDISVIRRFMLVMGPISSIYDFVTFWVMLRVFHFGEAAFHTGWFVESLATQTLVLFVIRTLGRPWTSRPSTPLAIATCAIVAIGVALPYTPLARVVGLTPLPVAYLGFVAAVVATYLVLVEIVKHRIVLARAMQRRPA